jgi:glycine/D-amino acid oxidase-like deaminating enzyme
MKLVPYWSDTAAPFRGAEAGPLEGAADVAVVGGGFTGLSAALALAKAGASVVVVEKGRVAGEASGRNGGHVNNGLSLDFRGAVAKLGLDRARDLYHAFDAGVDLVETIVREEQIECDFRRTGKIKLAAKPAHYDTLAATFEVMIRDVDPDMALVPKARIREEVGSDLYHGGLVFGKSGQMHMGKFAVGLADAAHRRGARIFENAALSGLARLPAEGHEVTTTRGTVRAKQVLLATGTSMTGPFSFFRRRIIPVGSFIITTEPLRKAALDDIMPTRRNATTSLHVGHYFRISPDDRLIFGGRARFALSSTTSDARSGRVLEAGMLAAFPQLKGTRVDYCWGGLVDMTADRMPRAGERDGVFHAMGYSGHGTQMSVLMGAAMAEVMGGRPAANPWRDMPWPAIPGHFGPPWFMPIVGAWYRLKDRLG